MKEVVGVTLKDGGRIYYFDPNGYKLKKNVTVIVETEQGQQFGKVTKENIEINPKDLSKELKKVIDSENYDIIHTHTPMGSVVTRLASLKARKNGTRVIYTAHGFHFYKGAPLLNWLLFYPVEKILARYTDELITINKEELNFDVFDRYKQFIPSYEGKLYHPVLQYF